MSGGLDGRGCPSDGGDRLSAQRPRAATVGLSEDPCASTEEPSGLPEGRFGLPEERFGLPEEPAESSMQKYHQV